MNKNPKFNISLISNTAITLIALVVTIIILLILAGVSIALVSGGNGILDKATNAVDETTKGSAKEELELYLSECKTNCYEEKYVNGTNISLIDLIDQDMNRTNEKEAKNGIIKLDKENKKLIYKINDKEVAEIYIEDIGSGTSTPTVQKYSIKYNANGGENAPTDENEYENGEEVSLNFTDIPTKTDYDFLGWSINKEATDPEYKNNGTNDKILIQDVDVELYAVWIPAKLYLYNYGVKNVAINQTYYYSNVGSWNSNNYYHSTNIGAPGTCLTTNKKIDVTNYRYLNAIVDYKSDNSPGTLLFASDTVITANTSNLWSDYNSIGSARTALHKISNLTRQNITVDLENINKEQYLGISFFGSTTVYLYSLYLSN